MSFTLHVLEGFKGVPSVDPFSALLVYMLKLNEVKIIKINYCKYSKSAVLPCLELEPDDIATKPAHIIEYIESAIHYTIAQRPPRPPRVNGEIVYKEYTPIYSYIEEDMSFLERLCLVNGWDTEDNVEYSIKLYSKGIFWPYRFAFRKDLKEIAISNVKRLPQTSPWKSVLHDKLYNESALRLAVYSDRLGSKTFMQGLYPSTIDLILCSYLAPAVLFDFPDKRMEELINSACPNMIGHINNFIDLFGDNGKVFPKEVEKKPRRINIPVLIAAGAFTVSSLYGLYELYTVFMN